MMPSASDAVRSFPYPVLDEGNLSFPNGSYESEFQAAAGGYTVHVRHEIQGAPLIRRLVEEGKAACSCVVAIPVTGYRRLFLAEGFRQEARWDKDSAGEPPVFQPQIVCVEDIDHTLNKDDGVHEMWLGRRVTFPKGGKISLGSSYRLLSSMQSLLSFERNDEKGAKQMSVSACSQEGFYFQVSVRADLYDFLNQPGEGNHLLCHSIMVHAASACFALLAEKYGDSENEEDSWRAHPNLRALAAEMESRNLTAWYEDDFRPEEAATEMWPHRIPASDQESEDV